MSPVRSLKIGTRGSKLALWQTGRIREILEAAGIPNEQVEIRTTGDIVQEVPLAQIGSRALFTRQIDEATSIWRDTHSRTCPRRCLRA